MESESLSAAVLKRIEELGISQRGYAERIGMSSSHVNQLVKGRIALPSAEVRRKLADDLGVSHLDILIAAGELTREEAEAGGIQQREAMSSVPEDVVRQLEQVPTWDAWHTFYVLNAIKNMNELGSHIQAFAEAASIRTQATRAKRDAENGDEE